MNQMKHANRVDVVWDIYFSDSLKAETRSKRGSKRRRGICRRAEKSVPIPGNWKDFLLISENKIELFSFLTFNVTAIETDKQIIVPIMKKSCAPNLEMCWVLLHVHRKRPIQE